MDGRVGVEFQKLQGLECPDWPGYQGAMNRARRALVRGADRTP
jgi:hypothetical protein